ncbi:SDR family oxidoreductase [Belliella sp. R4-6]|uniref:SDR family oxidoreductase n=1 Tax=Belliella alkalica TaxID=1730871 RepID=A0ABS9VF56_9BACT|nr:SDR family oxidoreductase [Belliella alkalica]MCH7415056.1 SDR family oxidoreductase [Belliella alkalica]
MILITGATGQLGQLTIENLLRKGVNPNEITALVRDKSKAEDLKSKGLKIKEGNYGDYESLKSAFQGVEKLLLISSSDTVNRSKQHENAVSAAIESGVKQLLYTSFFSNNPTDSSPISFVSESHLHTVKLIKESGTPYTILENNLYLEMLPIFFGEKVLENGIYLPAGEGKGAFASRADMAEAIGNVLIEAGHEGKSYNFSNVENVSISDIADILSKITNKTVAYINPSKSEYESTLENAGVPSEYIGMFAGFSEAISNGEFETNKSDLEKLLKRKPLSAEVYLKKVY